MKKRVFSPHNHLTMLSPVTINFIWTLCYITDEVNDKGQNITKSSFPKSHYRAALSLRDKIQTAIRVTVEGKEELLTQKEAEEAGLKITNTLLVAADITLTDAEKAWVSQCAKEATEYPAADEKTLTEFTEVTGVSV